ncbi:MAG: SGNH/GDSL hydrolase family protein [Bacilli bacterium]|nr:SGNH/GDSL hydrolase family protein [Bacilli bacterium]
MKKILIIVIIILSIFLIYLTTIDKKVYYLTLGDEITLGMTQEGKYERSYADYIKKYLQEKNILEIYINDYATKDYRITDLIKDIENNKTIENKTIKNSLIKSDLLTLSIGTNDIISKIDNMNKLTKLDYNKLYKNINEIIIDLDKLLKLIREYCKEDIIMTGIYIEPTTEELKQILEYANQKFKETTTKYNITYIDMYEVIKPSKPLNIYPNKQEHEQISKIIIDIINNNLLK